MMIRMMLLLVLPMFLGCGDDNGGKDGDADTDTDTDADVDDDACFKHIDCASDEICRDHECITALGRGYQFAILRAQVGTKDPNGDSWDTGGGAPDLVAQFYFENSGDSCVTDTVDDSFNPQWGRRCNMSMWRGDTLHLELFDEDITDYELAAAWVWEGSDALMSLAQTEGEQFTLEDSSGTIEITVAVIPQF